MKARLLQPNSREQTSVRKQRHRAHRISRRFNPDVIRQQILADPNSRRPFRELEKAGIPQGLLLERLVELARVLVSPGIPTTLQSIREIGAHARRNQLLAREFHNAGVHELAQQLENIGHALLCKAAEWRVIHDGGLRPINIFQRDCLRLVDWVRNESNKPHFRELHRLINVVRRACERGPNQAGALVKAYRRARPVWPKRRVNLKRTFTLAFLKEGYTPRQARELAAVAAAKS